MTPEDGWMSVRTELPGIDRGPTLSRGTIRVTEERVMTALEDELVELCRLKRRMYAINVEC